MKTSNGEISVLSLKEVKQQIASLKPHVFNLVHDRVIFIIQKDPMKDSHAGTWCLRMREQWRFKSRIAITFTNIQKQMIPEFLVHELNELIMLKTILSAEESAAIFIPILRNVTHYLSATSLNQYDREVATLNPILNHISSDRLVKIRKSKKGRSTGMKNKGERSEKMRPLGCICPGCRETVETEVLKNYRKITDVLYIADCYCPKCGAFLCCSRYLGPEEVPENIKTTLNPIVNQLGNPK